MKGRDSERMSTRNSAGVCVSVTAVAADVREHDDLVILVRWFEAKILACGVLILKTEGD